MDYEILSKLFDGPQNIFLSSSFICFSAFSKKIWGLRENVQTSHQGI